MRHFVAYHNTEGMGETLQQGDPLRLLANKPVQNLLHQTVWFITGDGPSPKRYALGSVFVVDDVGETNEHGFTRYASGKGHVFEPPPALNDLDWFPELMRALGNFRRGVSEIKEPHFIEALLSMAAAAGYRPA